MLLALLLVCLTLFVVLPLVGAALSTIVVTLFFGLLLGAFARLVAPGPTRGGLLLTSLVGVAGSLTGSVLAELLDTGGFGRLLLQIGAAVVLVLVLRPARQRPARQRPTRDRQTHKEVGR